MNWYRHELNIPSVCNNSVSINITAQKQGKNGQGQDAYYISDGLSHSFRQFLYHLYFLVRPTILGIMPMPDVRDRLVQFYWTITAVHLVLCRLCIRHSPIKFVDTVF